MAILSFEEAWDTAEKGGTSSILLGNGFSQAWDAKIFNYASLLEIADFGKREAEISALFASFETYDFEAIMRALLSAEKVLEVYGDSPIQLATIRADQETLKSSLLKAISDSHPELPSDLKVSQYENSREFLRKFASIFTVNYDLLMYWSRNKRDIAPDWDSDDGFRAGLLWRGFGTDQNIHFLHGGLHIFDGTSGVAKHAYDENGTIVERVKANLADNRFPIFVAEPTHTKKQKRIEKNEYLSFCFRALTKLSGTLFIYGHSMDENDSHIFSKIRESNIDQVFVSVYGDPGTDANRTLQLNAKRFLESARRPVEFFDASSAAIW